MNADKPSTWVRPMIDRGPLKRAEKARRKAEMPPADGLLAGTGRRTLASCREPTHTRRSAHGIWGIRLMIEPRGAKRGNALTDDSERLDLPDPVGRRQYSLGIFLTALVTLMVEILLTRVFDVILAVNISYLIITNAMFALGAAGVQARF